MTERNILINRAPVLTLWATTVSRRVSTSLRPVVMEFSEHLHLR